MIVGFKGDGDLFISVYRQDIYILHIEITATLVIIQEILEINSINIIANIYRVYRHWHTIFQVRE